MRCRLALSTTSGITVLTDADKRTSRLPKIGAVCDTPRGCENPADVMIWCDHHQQDCPYTGYRCRIHLNILVLELQRELESMRRAWLNYCARCGETVKPGEIGDHLRWIPL